MKIKHLLLIPICAAFLSFQGCSTVQNSGYATPDNAKIAATIVCNATLTFGIKPADQSKVAAYIYGIAHGLRSFANGIVPSPDEVKSTVSLYINNTNVGQWASLGTSIQSIYGGIYANLKGNPKLAAQYLEAIAEGCEMAAYPFVTHATPTPTP
jgi:hypothetical protein